jgi:hypothetical protein
MGTMMMRTIRIPMNRMLVVEPVTDSLSCRSPDRVNLFFGRRINPAMRMRAVMGRKDLFIFRLTTEYITRDVTFIAETRTKYIIIRRILHQELDLARN